MKVKALQSFICYLGAVHQDDVLNIELDYAVTQEWIANGLVEEVKAPSKKSVKTDENK